jgi:D-alanyl-D-alanine endopeptidase (penicillin-binding protein 7)
MHRRLSLASALSLALITALLGSGPRANAAAKPDVGPALKSAAALVVDARTGDVIYEHDATFVTPIASISKLMTALVVLDAHQPLDEVITLSAEDRWQGKGAFSRLPIGDKFTRGELLRLALMASENRASHSLARNYPGGIPAFLKAMNAKATALGMTRTHFDDPSGLSNFNVSNARDLTRLISVASRDATIREYSTLPSFDVKLGKKRFTYRNTNLLVGRSDWDIVVQKTGFTNDAGECLAMQTTIAERTVNMVFLNSFGKLTRTADARRVRKWMEAHQSPKLADAGAH